MGNLQSDSKGQKSGKGQSRGKGLIKSFNKKSPIKETQKTILSKKSQQSFVSLVSEPEASSETVDRLTVHSAGSTHVHDPQDQTPCVGVTSNDSDEKVEISKDLSLPIEKHSENQGFIVTDSWKEVGKYCGTNVKPSDPNSKQTDESSSDSIFTDPQTPVGFEAEINQCYYSRESVDNDDIVISENLEETMKRNKVGVLNAHEKSEPKSGLLETHLNSDTKENTKSFPTSFSVSRHKKVELISTNNKLTENNSAG